MSGSTPPFTGRAARPAAGHLGDVVIVRSSGERTVGPANGLNGWTLSWADRTAGSAV
ncbi:hypothetical protein [Streptomyces sp. NRRL F-3307]|uniref:hypothetical protein n=1 Tax=Streptomyces sp. NRRL F-3307 TaxID=1463849 RepID=UPI000AF5D08B|nr:hypothetical protein [Streptomyces sp. NRRL F-3307]